VSISSCSVQVSTLVEDEAATLQLGADESYRLSVSAAGECAVRAATVWGALHAMESFTQLLTRPGGGSGEVALDYLPVLLQDAARYSHRGLLIDSSRHFLPLGEILAVVDSLPMSKLNVLHWHIVDAQSFPMDPPSAPRLVRGAYSPAASYSMQDIQRVVQHGADRGVRVLLEIDVPGHAASWTEGYPEVMADCFVKYSYNINDFALDPTKEETYSLLRGVLGDAAEASGVAGLGGLLHIGGDEVVYGCWNNDTGILAYMAEHDLSSDELLMMFAERADEMLRDLKVTPVHWEEGEQQTNKQTNHNTTQHNTTQHIQHYTTLYNNAISQQ
jgi:hexosaminidase